MSFDSLSILLFMDVRNHSLGTSKFQFFSTSGPLVKILSCPLNKAGYFFQNWVFCISDSLDVRSCFRVTMKENMAVRKHVLLIHTFPLWNGKCLLYHPEKVENSTVKQIFYQGPLGCQHEVCLVKWTTPHFRLSINASLRNQANGLSLVFGIRF